VTRGVVRSEISDKDCADRLEALYATELALYNLHRNKALTAEDKAALPHVGLYSLSAGDNGGSDPYAPGPWSVDGKRKTSDCIGTASWARGFDRFQPKRFAHLYGGYINTDSMLLDAVGEFAVTGRGKKEAPRKMFRPASSFRRGVFIVYPGRYVAGRKVPGTYGHILTLVEMLFAEMPTVKSLADISDKLMVIHCHGGLFGRTERALSRETLKRAIGGSAARAWLIEMIPALEQGS
jgi:hypothetical protein